MFSWRHFCRACSTLAADASFFFWFASRNACKKVAMTVTCV